MALALGIVGVFLGFPALLLSLYNFCVLKVALIQSGQPAESPSYLSRETTRNMYNSPDSADVPSVYDNLEVPELPEENEGAYEPMFANSYDTDY